MSGKHEGSALARAPEAVEELNTAEEWVARFHRGERAVLAQCYTEYFSVVASAVGKYLSGVDQETVIHDVYLKLITDKQARASFKGGNFEAWISRVASNLTIDYLRKTRRDLLLDTGQLEALAGGYWDHQEIRVEARLLLQRFRQERLPREWEGVFVTRFIEQRTQRDAAKVLGIGRTTFAWRELRIRKLLRAFFLCGERTK